jgi:predicted enzyme related to lactoylglutathione lyase
MASFQTILIPTDDITASRELYRALLGVDPTVDAPYYVGFDVDGQHVGLVPGAGCVRPHLHVADIGAATQLVTAAGGSIVDAAKDVGGGRLVAVVRDAAGAEIGLIDDSGRG